MPSDFVFGIVDVGHVDTVVAFQFLDRVHFHLREHFGSVVTSHRQIVHRQCVLGSHVASVDTVAAKSTWPLDHALRISQLSIQMAIVVHHRNV